MRRKKALGKRSRYYHSQMVMEALESGEDYETIPDSFVIFVCDFDPFDKELYCYTFGSECQEDKEVELDDGCHTIFLSTRGKNDGDVSPELVRFLKFVTADPEESERDFEDGLVRRFQETIREIKADREMGGRYMIFEEMLREEKQEGRLEGRLEGIHAGKLEAKRESVLELLEELGDVPQALQDRIESLEDLEQLKILFKMAAKADSIPSFMEQAEPYLHSEEE